MCRSLPFLMAWAIFLSSPSKAFSQGASNTCAAMTSIHDFPVGTSCNLLSFNKPSNFTATIPASGCGAGSNVDAWTRFVATHTSTFLRYSTTHGNAVLSVFTGPCNSLVQVGCVNDFAGTAALGEEEKLLLNTVVGQTYIVRLEHVGANTPITGKLCLVRFDPPANDECVNAPTIGNGTTPFSTYGATGNDISSCTTGDSKDVWFRYESNCMGTTTVSTCGTADFNSALSVYSACGGAQIACNANGSGCAGGLSKVSFASTLGGAYWIRVSGENSGMGSGTLEITCEVTADHCSSASPIADGSTAYRNTASTGSDVTSCGVNDNKDIWMRYTASCAGEVTISNCGAAGFNTTLAAFATCGGAQITCNDDAVGCGTASAITFRALPGEEFIIRLAGVGATKGFGSLTTTCTPIVWYSRSSGSTNAPIWSRTPTGPSGPAVIDAYSSLVVQPGHSITQAGNDLTMRQLVVTTGGTYALAGTAQLELLADLIVEGTFEASTGLVRFAGTNKQLIAGSSMTTFHDLTQANDAGIMLDTDLDIRGTLLLVSGEFNANGRAVRLVSDATSTARLGPVGAGATFQGALTMERYVPAGATNWRLIGGSVGAATVNDLKDDFFTAGFPGAHSPAFSSPVGSGILWPSVRYYDETAPGDQVNDGLIGAISTAQPLTPGLGLAVWSGTTFSTTTAFTIDVTGPPTIATAPIELPMSYTDNGAPATDGWNLVSNPLPSPIRFDQMVLGADVEDNVVYFDPATGNNASYDISLGVGMNGGSNIIQSGQGFWLKANGPAVTTTVNENAKTIGNGGGFFGGHRQQLNSMVRLRISSAINQFSDETIVVFNAGTAGLDTEDVPKFVFAHPQAPQIGTSVDGTVVLAINAFGNYTTDIAIPVLVNVAVNGDYAVTASDMDNLGLTCLSLEDLATGTITPLSEGASYTFTALASDDESQVRFVLRGTAPVGVHTIPVSCHGMNDGSAALDLGADPVVVTWHDDGGVVLLAQAGAATLEGLAGGEYTVRVSDQGACEELSTVFVIEEPSAIEVTAEVRAAQCPSSSDGRIDVAVLGGEAPYTYTWSNGSTGSSIVTAPGQYAVLVTDANGCAHQSTSWQVEPGEGPLAAIFVENSFVPAGTEVTFHSGSGADHNHQWDMGDGTLETSNAPIHSYTEPGVYIVTLIVDDGTCADTVSMPLTVEVSTGLPTLVGPSLNAWVSGDHIIVDHHFDSVEPVFVRLLSTSGQLIQEHRFTGRPERITLPTAELEEGIWLVQISCGTRFKTFALPVLR
jgi:PKD domain/SprB repeat